MPRRVNLISSIAKVDVGHFHLAVVLEEKCPPLPLRPLEESLFLIDRDERTDIVPHAPCRRKVVNRRQKIGDKNERPGVAFGQYHLLSLGMAVHEQCVQPRQDLHFPINLPQLPCRYDRLEVLRKEGGFLPRV